MPGWHSIDIAQGAREPIVAVVGLVPVPNRVLCIQSPSGGTMARRGRHSGLGAIVRKAPSPIHGFGCFSRVEFLPGEHIGSYEGPRVSADGTYVLWVYDAEGRTAIAREGRNLLRWLNHSADPNAEFDAFELYARRRIEPGEEITIDYAGATLAVSPEGEPGSGG